MPDRNDDNDDQEVVRPRPFWSGTIAFGLVSLPVSLFPANRGGSLSLKMVDDGGTPLRRRYFCEKEQKALEREDIVRGYEFEKNHYVVVQDEELEALAPEKSREIDLRRFVALSEISPMFFERAYFLVPDEGATKAYRLLAKSMEDEQRAGIATFVMRDKEYLVAIIAEKGILRAETLRFHDEIRTAEYVGLPEIQKPDKAQVSRMQKAMKPLTEKKLDRSDLIDRHTRKVMDYVETKLRSGKDVVKAPEDEAEEYAEEDNVIDLMQVLKERLKGEASRESGDGERKPEKQAGGDGRKHPAGASVQHETLEDSTKDELYERAKELHIPGRSGMSKQQLIEALSKR